MPPPCGGSELRKRTGRRAPRIGAPARASRERTETALERIGRVRGVLRYRPMPVRRLCARLMGLDGPSAHHGLCGFCNTGEKSAGSSRKGVCSPEASEPTVRRGLGLRLGGATIPAFGRFFGRIYPDSLALASQAIGDVIVGVRVVRVHVLPPPSFDARTLPAERTRLKGRRQLPDVLAIGAFHCIPIP